jgi:hypothetical protein
MVNNVFYQPFCDGTGAGGSSPIFALGQSQIGMQIAGNVYVRNSDNGCSLMAIATTQYNNIQDLHANNWEVVSGVFYGGNFSASNATMQRIRNTIPVLNNDFEDGPVNGNGDFINSTSVAVGSNGVELDPVFNSPGLEVPIAGVTDVYSEMNNAYQYLLYKPVGKKHFCDVLFF